jgi:cyclopropane fatty-acyl-phospholipid synthase-like methyltransferase
MVVSHDTDTNYDTEFASGRLPRTPVRQVRHRSWRTGSKAAFTLWTPCFGWAWGTHDEAIADDLVGMLTIKPGNTVAEIGAGNGAMAVRVAKKVGPAGRVIATEIDPALVERIRQRARNASLDNVPP